MKTKHWGLIALLLITTILISGCGEKPADQSEAVNDINSGQNQNQDNNQANAITNPSGYYSINELFAINKPMKCTWKESLTEGSEVTNILYINGKKFYQEVTMGDIGHTYTVTDGEYFYIWNDFTNAASKFKNIEVKTGDTSEQAKTKDSVNLEQKKDFVCEGWSPDNSIFNPPQDKNFQDMTQEMTQATQKLQENSQDYKQQACDLCQKVPDQATKDECLENMNCGE